MYISKDGLLTIEVAKDLSQTLFPPADFSIVEAPDDPKKAADLYQHLYDMPCSRHSTLILFRGRRINQLKAISNIMSAPFELLDFIHILYEKASSSSNQGFLPLAELGLVMFKGLRPNISNTKWFTLDESATANASNVWDVTRQPGEPGKFTHFQRVSWEMILLMYSLTAPREHQRMIYTLKSNYESMIGICKKYSIKLHLYVDKMQEAEKIINKYNNGKK